MNLLCSISGSMTGWCRALLATAGEEFARAEKLSRGWVISRSPGTLHIKTFQFYSTASRWQGKSHKYDRDREVKPVWFFVPGCVLSRASIHFSCGGGSAVSKALYFVVHQPQTQYWIRISSSIWFLEKLRGESPLAGPYHWYASKPGALSARGHERGAKEVENPVA